jgi:tetratricopeptide (TPR) repeat protein
MTQVERYLAPGQASRVASFLGQMAQISSLEDLPSLQAARLGPRLMSDQMRMAWLDWLSAMCDRRPVMLVLEDLQWGDGASVALAGMALRVLHNKPLLVLALAQPEADRRFMTLWREHAPQRIHLAPLSPRQSQRLIEYVAGSLSSTDVQAILERAQGNPFGLEESLRATLCGEPVRDGPPDTLVGMVQARLRSLDHESRLALGACSVLGRGIRANAVKAIVDSDDHLDVDRCLALLEERESLFSFASTAGREFAFRHPLVRQAAYDMLPRAEQRLGHLSAGRLLEQAREPNAYVLAEHFSRGRDKPRAIHWLKQAARQALQADDAIGTLALVTRALKEGACDEDERALRVIEAQIRLWHEDHPEAERAAQVAVSSSVAETRWTAKATLLEALAAQSRLGDVEQILASLGPPPEQPDLVGYWVACLLKSTAFLVTPQAGAARERILEQLERLSRPDALWAGDAEALRAQLAQAAGQPTQAQASYVRAADLYARLDDRRAECTTRAKLGQLLLSTGQLEMADDCLRSVHDTARRLEFTPLLGRVAADLTRVLAYRGGWNEARNFGERALAISEARNDRNTRGEAACGLSLAALLTGHRLAAEKYAVEGAAGVEAGSTRHGFAQALLARALMAQGRTSEALHHARAAYARLEGPAALDGFEGTICLAMAECLRSIGDAVTAREVLRRAADRLGTLATAITDLAARRSYLTELPENARLVQLCQQAGFGVPAVP